LWGGKDSLVARHEADSVMFEETGYMMYQHTALVRTPRPEVVDPLTASPDQSECISNKFLSCTCIRGTHGCNVRHTDSLPSPSPVPKPVDSAPRVQSVTVTPTEPGTSLPLFIDMLRRKRQTLYTSDMSITPGGVSPSSTRTETDIPKDDDPEWADAPIERAVVDTVRTGDRWLIGDENTWQTADGWEAVYDADELLSAPRWIKRREHKRGFVGNVPDGIARAVDSSTIEIAGKLWNVGESRSGLRPHYMAEHINTVVAKLTSDLALQRSLVATASENLRLENQRAEGRTSERDELQRRIDAALRDLTYNTANKQDALSHAIAVLRGK